MAKYTNLLIFLPNTAKKKLQDVLEGPSFCKIFFFNLFISITD